MTWFQSHIGLSILLGIAGIFCILGLYYGFKPSRVNISSIPNPARNYEQALARIDVIKEYEASLPELNPDCETIFLSHGNSVDNVVVFLHGFTTCPQQFRKLGEEFYLRGCNVYIPRIPKHGFKDRLGTALTDLTSEELVEFATHSLDIAQGLGRKVTVSGLSGGGVLAVWLAQERADVDVAVPISPSLGISFIPAQLSRFFIKLISIIPNFFMWWDPVSKENNPLSSDYQYVRYPI